jgi:hypothetical protein
MDDTRAASRAKTFSAFSNKGVLCFQNGTTSALGRAKSAAAKSPNQG